MTGERDKDIGPTTAPVDAAHASHAAARRAALTTAGAASAAELDPAVSGQWHTLAYDLPLRAIHVTLLRTGKFLLIAGSGNDANDHVIGNFKAYLWSPSTATLTSVPVPDDAFCSGHLVDANGDVIVFGGTVRYKDANGPWIGSDKVYKFAVATSTWVAMPPMKQGRWYPTALVDGKNRFLAYSGKDATGATPATPERYDPATNTWTSLALRTLPLYPGLHLLDDGRIAYTGAHYGGNTKYTAMAFNPTTGSRVLASDPSGVMDLAHRNAAMSALVGSADKQVVWVAGGGFPALASTYFLNLKTATPTAVAGPDLPAAKGYVSVSQLPDLTALETGGGTARDSPVFEASILDPGTSRLTPMAPPTVPRTYHSSSLTMPDGRVVTFGGDPSNGDFELRIEIFEPPYLFKGPRPQVTSKPTEVRYGTPYTVGVTAQGATPASTVLMRPGSATHSMDANQRVLKLTTRAVTGGVRVTLPTNPNLAPPGWYLLFVNDSLGRPAKGKWVHLR